MGERGLHASWQEHFVFQDVDFNNEAIASRSRVRNKMEVFHAIYSLKQRLHTSWCVRLRLLLPSSSRGENLAVVVAAVVGACWRWGGRLFR